MARWTERDRWLVVALIALPMVWLFSPALVGGKSFVFRDAAHFYYPLFYRNAADRSEGHSPLWNPRENLGQPLAADATASLFYPGKVVFAAPLPYSWRYRIYILAHVVLAAAGAFWLARNFNASVSAAGMAALAYALSGHTLAQCFNVIYLVGAGWLPFAFLAADRALKRRSFKWSLVLGACLALITLGGDPQTAYHVGLLAALYAWMLRRHDRCQQQQCPKPSGSARMARNRFVLLSLAAATGIALSAVQVLPSIAWARETDRAFHSVPRSVYEIPAALRADQKEDPAGESIAEGLFGTPPPRSHHRTAFQFSVAPWRWAELICPNISGCEYPIHRRWLAALPAEQRAWSPSLYLGLIPFVLAAGAWRLRRRDDDEPVSVRWMTWITLLGFVGALGGYGLGWIAHEIHFATTGGNAPPLPVGPQVGGLYWLMTVLLPGYVYFRYPAKLLTVAMLGLSMLAARGFDRLDDEKRRRTTRGALLVIGILSLVGMSVAIIVRQVGWEGWMRQVPPSTYFGPFDSSGAFNGILMALAHCAILAALSWWCMRRMSGSRLAIVLLALTAIDLAIAQKPFLQYAPVELWEKRSPVATAIAADRPEEISAPRIYRGASSPGEWSETSSATRPSEGLVWDRATLFPKYNLLDDIGVVQSHGSAMTIDHQAALGVAFRHGTRSEKGSVVPHRGLLDLLGAQYLLVPEGAEVPGVTDDPRLLIESTIPNAQLWRNPHVLPRAWVVHHVEWMPPLSSLAVEQRTEQAFFPDEKLRDFRQDALVESRSRPPWIDSLDGSKSTEEDRCFVVIERPDQVEIDVEMESPGLLILADSFDPGWRAEIDTVGMPARPAEIIQTNRLLRGVYLPAGEHRVIFRYRSIPLHWGRAISALAWLALIFSAPILNFLSWCCSSQTAGVA